MEIKIFHYYQSAPVLPQHLEKMNLYNDSQPLLFRQRVSFETLFEIPDVMNLSNSDCAARYDVTYLNSHTPANIFFLKDEASSECYQVLQCSLLQKGHFFPTVYTLS